MNSEVEVIDSDEEHKKSRCFSNLLKGKKVTDLNECFKSTLEDAEDNKKISHNSSVESENNINGNSGITNVALCCAITETSKTPLTLKCIGNSKFSSDSYQKAIKNDDNMEFTAQELSNTKCKNNDYLQKTKIDNNESTQYIKNDFVSMSIQNLNSPKDVKPTELVLDMPFDFEKRKSLRSNKLGRPKSLSELPRRSSSLDSTESSSVNSSLESLIKRSISAAKALHPVPVSKVKKRNYLHGRSGAVSMLGTTELERVFPNREVRIYITTWNMNGEGPPSDLSELFLPEKLETLPDIYAIGTQESVSDTSEWEVTIQETIGPSHVLFHSETLGTIYLGIFIRRELIWFCSEPEDTSFSTRPGSAFKTKGAVGICFYLFGTSFLFVSSHLTAHDDKVKDRINDVKRICKSLELPKDLPVRHRSRDVTQNFDYVFWFGDLNFRLTQPRAQVIDWLSNQKFPLESPLQSPLYDQLASSMRNGLVFRNFQEPALTFKPTYKYDPGTQEFDTSHKQRTPSYTDRILFKVRKSGSILLPIIHNNYSVDCLAYTSVPSLVTSDHKPVWGLFKCKIRPGSDAIPLAAGLFNRDVYLDGLKRRAQSRRGSSDSSVCVVQ